MLGERADGDGNETLCVSFAHQKSEISGDGDGYRTALFRIWLSGRLDYTGRNLIEMWFHTFKQRIDRFHTSWMGSRPSVQQCLE